MGSPRRIHEESRGAYEIQQQTPGSGSPLIDFNRSIG